MREPPLASAPVVTPEPAGLAARRETAIEVVGARTHNLKGVSCRVPHGRLTVVTGPSGAGKSSLVFDTIYAEGQRRFVESMSTYARQFLDQMERPPLDDLRHILPAVALEAKNSVRNARSTVATITETHDVLRLLFAHLGEVGCPRGHGPARRFTAAEAAADLAAGASGSRFTLVARLPRPRRGADGKLAELVRQGFARRFEAGEVVPIEAGESWPKPLDPLPLVLGRFAADPAATARLAATIEDGWRLAGGALEAIGESTRFYAPELGCPECGLAVRSPGPALFSFNSPLGACPTCEGFGRVIGIDAERVVPDPGRSLAEHPIARSSTATCWRRRRSAGCRSTARGGSCGRPIATGSGAARGTSSASSRSSAGSRRAPTRCTCASCSPAIAPTTPVPTAAARDSTARRGRCACAGGRCPSWRRSRSSS